MAIARKPKSIQDPSPTINVEALIAKGGSIATPVPIASKPSEEGGTTSFTLRVPNEILAPLDSHRKKQSYKVPRQQWILEAILQRLEREALPYAPKDE
jgi:hypothetical protein